MILHASNPDVMEMVYPKYVILDGDPTEEAVATLLRVERIEVVA